MNSKAVLFLAAAGLYLVSTGISFAVFSGTDQKQYNQPAFSPLVGITQTQKTKYKVDPSVPRDQICPLNGQKYTSQEKEIWEKRRPLAVMIENSAEARPHSGLSRADIVFEALAEGWITRFMSIFYCNTPMENIAIAPVRSARTYFIDWVSEYDGLYTHVGGANRIVDLLLKAFVPTSEASKGLAQ